MNLRGPTCPEKLGIPEIFSVLKCPEFELCVEKNPFHYTI
jgi:hypothetical protein